MNVNDGTREVPMFGWWGGECVFGKGSGQRLGIFRLLVKIGRLRGVLGNCFM